MQLRPSSPMPKAATVDRRERSWVFSAGNRHFSFSRTEYTASFATGHRIVAPRQRGWRPTAIIGTILGMLGGATMIGLAINSSRASAGYRYVVSMPLPPVRTFPARPDLKSKMPVTAERRASSSRSVANQSPPLAETAATNEFTVGDLDTVEATAVAASMTVAIRAAMSSGHLQQWTAADGSERGFVVVGPADGTSGCRSLSILTRRDGDNRVEQRRECTDKVR